MSRHGPCQYNSCIYHSQRKRRTAEVAAKTIGDLLLMRVDVQPRLFLISTRLFPQACAAAPSQLLGPVVSVPPWLLSLSLPAPLAEFEGDAVRLPSLAPAPHVLASDAANPLLLAGGAKFHYRPEATTKSVVGEAVGRLRVVTHRPADTIPEARSPHHSYPYQHA